MVVTAVEESSTHGLEYGSVLESCSSQEEASNMFIEWHKIFIPGTMKIDKRYTNCWLENVPNLSEECSQTKVADLLGKKVKIGNEEFSTELLSLADASRLLVPRKFGEAFSFSELWNWSFEDSSKTRSNKAVEWMDGSLRS